MRGSRMGEIGVKNKSLVGDALSTMFSALSHSSHLPPSMLTINEASVVLDRTVRFLDDGRSVSEIMRAWNAPAADRAAHH